MLDGIGCGAGVSVRECIIDLLLDNLDGVCGGVCLAEALVFCEPVNVGDDVVGLVEVGEQIQRAGSSVPLVRLVFCPHKVLLDRAQKLSMKGAVDVPKVFERKRGRVMSVANGRCFESGGAFQYDGRRSGIGRGHEPCFQEGRVDGGGEGEAKVSERAAAKVCVSQRRV